MVRSFGFVISLIGLLFVLDMPILSATNKTTANDPISIEVALSRDEIGLDEQATLQVAISGNSQNLPEPDIPNMPNFEVYSQGRSSNISIVNGQMSATVTYRYLLVPQQAGTFPISNIGVLYNRKRYKANSVTLTVLNKGTATPPKLEQKAEDGSSPGQTKDYFLEADVDNKNPYVNEQVTFTLRFFIGVQYYGSPELTEPVTTGFWTEVLGNKAPYYQKVKNRTYKVIERKYALFPTQTGELTIGRATIRTTVAARGRNYRDPFSAFGDFFGRGQEVSSRSDPVKIDVRPIPDQGRPKEFSGTIGRFSISAKADKRQVEVNQPVSVEFQISGTGNVKSVAEPKMPEMPEFRIYRESSNENLTKLQDKIGGTKTFREVFIPREPGEFQIPPVDFTYFDPKAERYRKISTDPITVYVTKPEGYVASPDMPYARPDVTIGSEAKDIRYIKTTFGGVQRRGNILLTSPLYVIVNGLPVLLLAGMILVRQRREKLLANRGLARSRAAARMARKRLAHAKSLAKPESAGAFFSEIQAAVTSYIADKLNISPNGLTVEMIGNHLTDRGADESLVDETTSLLQQADFARFAPASLKDEEIDHAYEKAVDVMTRIEGVRFA
jgi:hypothetical protein